MMSKSSIRSTYHKISILLLIYTLPDEFDAADRIFVIFINNNIRLGFLDARTIILYTRNIIMFI